MRNEDNPQVQQTSLAELHRLSITLSNLYDVAPTIIGVGKMLPYQLHQKLRQAQQIESSSSNLSVLRGLTFFGSGIKRSIGNERMRTNGKCCFNHVVGLPQKDIKNIHLFDYEKILYDSLMSIDGSFKDKHLWVKKATGLGVTEFMLRMMAWLCTRNDDATRNMSDVHSHRTKY